jgi:hypothetical protein
MAEGASAKITPASRAYFKVLSINSLPSEFTGLAFPVLDIAVAGQQLRPFSGPWQDG